MHRASGIAQSPQATCLTLRLEKGEDVLLTDRALHVADDRPGGVIHELDADLRHASTRARAAEDLDNFGELDGGFCGGFHRGVF